jgi:hypothetical protein
LKHFYKFLFNFNQKKECQFDSLNYEDSSLVNENSNKLFLNIQILICTDYSIFKMHKQMLENKRLNNKNCEINDDSIKESIITYYKQIINDVNARYRMSFKDDSDLSFSISISDFYIATVILK